MLHHTQHLTLVDTNENSCHRSNLYLSCSIAASHISWSFFVPSQNVQEQWYTYVCMSSLRKGHVNICMYIYTWHEVARLGTCYSMLYGARLTCNWHATGRLHSLWPRHLGSVAVCMICSRTHIICQKLVVSTPQCMLVYALGMWMTTGTAA